MPQLGINRNILECKARIARDRRRHVLVLIETYWNVKCDRQSSKFCRNRVLIETYWNVKILARIGK